MKCADFEEIVVELARGEPIAGAREHAQSCASCRARLETEQELSGRLSELAAGGGDAGAPPRIEAALLAAFRERRRARPKVAWQVWALTAAAGLTMGALAVQIMRAPPQAERPHEIVTQFFPLDYSSDAGLDGAAVVRLRVPRSTLARVGLPVNPDRAAEPVDADVVVGADGRARAIRFARPRE